MTGWEKGQLPDREALIGLVRHEEWNQLHFSAALRERKSFRLVNDGLVYVLKDRYSRKLRGALYLNRGGALHCCFEPSDLRQEDLDRLGRLLTERSLFSFIGRADRIKLIEELYASCDSRGIDYDLMIKERPFGDNQFPPGYLVRSVGKDDLDELFPLELAYQREEVLRDPDSLNEKFLKKRFHRQLGMQHIWAVYKRGKPVAKGGTNAVGFGYCQIGGVYTLPEERGRGIARSLMNHISGELYRDRWGTSLFVRKDNSAAQALYEHCGYRRTGDFRIVYPDNS